MSLGNQLRRLFGAKKWAVAEGNSQDEDCPAHFFWGMRDIPMQEATQHFLVVGAPQSGKTMTIRLLMQSVIPFVGRGCGHRAFVYDAKREFLPLLAEMWGKEPVTLDPFDQRGHPWDMAVDIATEADAAQLAGMLIPEEPHASQRFFSDGARDLLHAVLVSLIETSPGRWTFRDALLALEDTQTINQIVHKSEDSVRIANRYMEDEKTLPSVVSTVATKLRPFSVVAGLWANSKQKPISLTEWLNTEGVLVVASHPRYSESLRPLTQAIFRRVSDLVLSRPDTDPDEERPWRTWFFLDEVREAGRLNGLHPLLNMGRSKGACMVLGFQDIAGMQAEYGDKIADEIAGQCAYKSFLRSGSQVTAKWAQEHLGQAERIRPKYSESKSYSDAGLPAGSQESISYDYVVENAVLASEITSIPAPDAENGLIGFHDAPRRKAYRTQTAWCWLMQNLWKPSEEVVKSVPKSIPRDAKEQKLRTWEEADYQRLWPKEQLEKEQARALRKGSCPPGSPRPEGTSPGQTHPGTPGAIGPGTFAEGGEPDRLGSGRSEAGASGGKAKKTYDAKKADLFGIEPPGL